MALYGKVGDQVVLRENINTLLNAQGNQQMQYNPNAGQNNFMNQNQQRGQANVKIDFSRFIRMRFNNPGSVDIASNANASRDDFLRQLKEVKVPDLSNIQRILESCDNTKQDYNNYLALNVRLDDILKNKVEANPAPKQQGYNPQSHIPHQDYSNPEQHFPQQQAKGYNEFDVQRFVGKFKCAREMALGYLEAFGNYNEAERQFILNTGWKG